MKNLLHRLPYYLRVYRRLCIANASVLLVYRWNFINNIVTSFVWGALTIVSILFLTSRTNVSYGWKPEEIVLLASVYSMMIGIFHMLFSRNFEHFSWIVERAELDGMLLKPIDVQFMVSTRIINYASLTRVLLGGIAVALVYRSMHTVPSASAMLFAVFLLVIGTATLYFFWFIAMTLVVWFPRLSNIVDFMYSVSSLARYPKEMSEAFLGFLFILFLPVSLVITVPVKTLLGRASVNDYISLAVSTVVIAVVCRLFWKRALKHYESGGG